MAVKSHTLLAAVTFEIGKIIGCRLLLKNNALLPSFLVAPKVESIEDLHHLPSGWFDRFDRIRAAARSCSDIP